MKSDLVFGIVLVLGFLAPIFSKALKVPTAVGELFLGIVAGQTLEFFQFKNASDTLSFLSNFGFIMLMFLGGLEIDFDLIKTTGKKSLILYIIYSILVILFGFLISFLFGFNIVVGFILSLCSIGLLIAVLKNMDLEKSESGKLVLVIGSVGEIISLFTLLVLNKSSNINNLQTLLNQSFKIAAFFILSYIVFKLIKLLIWWYPEIIENVIFKEDASSVELRLSFFVMFLMASLASLAGIEFILGAFMGGAIFSYFLREKESLEQKLSSIGYGFFIPIFFINTGLNIHIQSFNLEIISKTLLYAFLIFLLKFLASPILFFANRNLKFSLLTPLFLSFPFSILIAAIELTNNLHLINSQERLELYFSAILSSLIYPSVLKLFVKELN